MKLKYVLAITVASFFSGAAFLSYRLTKIREKGVSKND